MTTEDYISFETAKLLKEKGFDEKVDTLYKMDGEFLKSTLCINYNNPDFELSMHNVPQDTVSAPTLQMAMKWLREKNWFVQIQIQNDGTYIGYIYRTDGFPYVGWDKIRVKETPEEACEAAIKYCLENLI